MYSQIEKKLKSGEVNLSEWLSGLLRLVCGLIFVMVLITLLTVTNSFMRR